MPDEFIDNEFGKFAEMTNDNHHPELHAQADVILLAISGVGKSTISNELAKRSIKAANIALVYEIEFLRNNPARWKYTKSIGGDDLKKFVKEGKPKVIYLFCPVKEVIGRRRGVLKYNHTFREIYKTDYPGVGDMFRTNQLHILEEIRFANSIANEIGATHVDTSRLSKKETTDKIVEILTELPSPHKPTEDAEPPTKTGCTL